MNEDKLNKFVLDSPKILLRGKRVDLRFTDYLMSEGVYPGWFELVYDFLVEASKTRKVDIAQIKEKFGRLTIYIYGSEKQYKLAQKYEKMSASICAECGAPGTLTDKSHGYWMYTLCDTHKKMYKDKRI